MIHKGRVFSALVIVLSLLLTVSGLATAAPSPSAPANGTVKPFGLGATALQDKSGLTDLYLGVTSNNAGYPVPQSLQKVQLKSYKPDGKLAYTKNFQNTPAPGGRADIQLTDVTRYQPLKTQVNVKTAQTVNEEILEAQAMVLLRPDLTVEHVSAPAEVYPNTAFPVNVLIKELNGDVGATSTVRILNGATVLDSVANVNTAAGSNAAMALALNLATEGTYTLTVRIGDVVPGDYDTTNNEATFTVKVVQPYKTVQYSSYYDSWERSYNYDRTYWYGGAGDSYHQEEAYESFSVWTSTPDQYDLAGTLTLKLTSETGATTDLSLTGLTVGFQYRPEINGYVQIYQGPWGTQLNLWSYSGRWMYSQNWYDWYGSGGYSYGYSYGMPILGARQQLSVLIDLPSTNSTHYGGNYTLSLQGWNNTWDYQYYDWWDWWYGGWTHYWGTDAYSYGYGGGTTSW